jgi:CheY-like chemotaxis protein
VIDDEETVRMLAYRILERYGVPALMAANGAAGLEIVAARGDELAAVLLDLTMPGLSGVETLRRLRAIRPDLPVLLTSGYSAESALEIAGGNARIDFIQKPYRPQELIAKLQALVG